MSLIISKQNMQQFRDEGYMVLESMIPEDVLVMLREECSYFLGYMDAQMDAAGKDSIHINHRGKRYFISNRYRRSQRMWRFLFGSMMARIAQLTLGPDVYLFHEQWVIKGAEQGMSFSWHQDSGYVKFRDPNSTLRPYLSCWCTLDDVNDDNGTVHILPHSRGGTRDRIFDHERDAETNDLIGYRGDDPGIGVVAPAGSIVAFTSYNLHCSGANTTDRMRRVYLAQYSAEPIKTGDGKLWSMAVPFVKGDQVIYDREKDMAPAI